VKFVILALERWKWEYHKFQGSLGYIAKPYFKNKNKTPKVLKC
jgi:hypothetical protein